MIKLNKQRKAFSMIMAIALIIIMATLTVLITNVTGKIGKETTAIFKKEQAIILAKSYTEYAILAVSANDRKNNPCIETINGTIGNPDTGFGYEVTTTISYIGDIDVATCNNVLSSAVQHDESKLSVIIDVYVRYKEVVHTDLANSPWFTYHNRSLQKI